GATCHVATRKEYFSSYTPGDFGVVRMGNTGLSRIPGIGNVKHVPDMRLNIISTGLLDEDGYQNSSGNGLWKVKILLIEGIDAIVAALGPKSHVVTPIHLVAKGGHLKLGYG
nr:retrovirus-related Pol polyprotein from transposon TNT 1-94 [Tanacetum cinerariifolium]